MCSLLQGENVQVLPQCVLQTSHPLNTSGTFWKEPSGDINHHRPTTVCQLCQALTQEKNNIQQGTIVMHRRWTEHRDSLFKKWNIKCIKVLHFNAFSLLMCIMWDTAFWDCRAKKTKPETIACYDNNIWKWTLRKVSGSFFDLCTQTVTPILLYPDFISAKHL